MEKRQHNNTFKNSSFVVSKVRYFTIKDMIKGEKYIPKFPKKSRTPFLSNIEILLPIHKLDSKNKTNYTLDTQEQKVFRNALRRSVNIVKKA